METEVGVDVGAEVAVWVVEIGQGLAQCRHRGIPSWRGDEQRDR
jgi:hypothetical protein